MYAGIAPVNHLRPMYFLLRVSCELLLVGALFHATRVILFVALSVVRVQPLGILRYIHYSAEYIRTLARSLIKTVVHEQTRTRYGRHQRDRP